LMMNILCRAGVDADPRDFNQHHLRMRKSHLARILLELRDRGVGEGQTR
jgi:hypothetical protein